MIFSFFFFCFPSFFFGAPLLSLGAQEDGFRLAGLLHRRHRARTRGPAALRRRGAEARSEGQERQRLLSSHAAGVLTRCRRGSLSPRQGKGVSPTVAIAGLGHDPQLRREDGPRLPCTLLLRELLQAAGEAGDARPVVVLDGLAVKQAHDGVTPARAAGDLTALRGNGGPAFRRAGWAHDKLERVRGHPRLAPPGRRHAVVVRHQGPESPALELRHPVRVHHLQGSLIAGCPGASTEEPERLGLPEERAPGERRNVLHGVHALLQFALREPRAVQLEPGGTLVHRTALSDLRLRLRLREGRAPGAGLLVVPAPRGSLLLVPAAGPSRVGGCLLRGRRGGGGAPPPWG